MIGQVTAVGGGRQGVVVDARAVGAVEDGRQTFRLAVRSERPDPAAVDDRLELSPAARSAVPEATRDGPTAAARLPAELSAEERAAVDRLRARDAQVRQEEEAHAAVAGDLAGPIAYSYQRGPDGRQYAVGGSVQVGGSGAVTPEGRAADAARLAAAANAATNPSAADLAVARDSYAAIGEAASRSRAVDLET